MSEPSTFWSVSGEIGWFAPVPTHEPITSPTPPWRNFSIRPFQPAGLVVDEFERGGEQCALIAAAILAA